jgi:hypothetical protein
VIRFPSFLACKCEFQGGGSSPGKLRTMLLGVDRKPKEEEHLHSTFTSRSQSSHSSSSPPPHFRDAGTCYAPSFLSFVCLLPLGKQFLSLLRCIFFFSFCPFPGANRRDSHSLAGSAGLISFSFVYTFPGKCFPSKQSVPF